MYDVIMIYLFVGLSVTAEALFRMGGLLFSGSTEGRKYRAHWKDIVAESHMPVALAVFITLVVAAIQIALRILLWPITVVHLYFKYNKD